MAGSSLVKPGHDGCCPFPKLLDGPAANSRRYKSQQYVAKNKNLADTQDMSNLALAHGLDCGRSNARLHRGSAEKKIFGAYAG
jgi:hypothetical protein